MAEEKKRFERRVTAEGIFLSYASPRRTQYALDGVPYEVQIDILNRCPGGCIWCFAGSNPQGTYMMPRGRLLKLLDEAASLGTREIQWQGGDPLLHPHLFEAIEHAGNKGMKSCIFTSGVPLTRQMCQEIVKQPSLIGIAINMNTINPDIFVRDHNYPKVLQQKIRGWRNLLEAGFLPERIFPSATFTRNSAEGVEEFIDWCVDEMGVQMLFLFPYIPWRGVTQDGERWEPSKEQVKRALNYRARKLSPLWEQVGPIDCHVNMCRYHIFITGDGSVIPCNYFPHLSAGNIYERSLVDIHEAHRDMLHFKNLRIKGKCGDCEYNEYCWGCRAKAYHYLGDIEASDPKCWRNPEAPEYAWSREVALAPRLTLPPGPDVTASLR